MFTAPDIRSCKNVKFTGPEQLLPAMSDGPMLFAKTAGTDEYPVI